MRLVSAGEIIHAGHAGEEGDEFGHSQNTWDSGRVGRRSSRQREPSDDWLVQQGHFDSAYEVIL